MGESAASLAVIAAAAVVAPILADMIRKPGSRRSCSSSCSAS
jgi:hypothetical protein